MANKKNLKRTLAICLACSIQTSTAHAAPAQPVDTKGSMRNIFAAYRELQPFLIKSDAFFDEANRTKIDGLINEINNGFHSVDKIDEKFKKQPGFETNIRLVRETLTQVSKDMKTEPSEYDLLRLKAISQNCLSCHSTYKPESKFESIVPPEIEGDLLAKANYLAATRQFKEAEEAYYEAAMKAEPNTQILQPLRYWLVVETRINEEPTHAINRLESLLKAKKNILTFEKGEINSWLDGLNRWKRDAVTLPPLKKAEFLLRQTINSPEPAYSRTPEVEVLRASGILHRAFADGTITATERGQALYILGLSYSKLPLFFPDELPEFYLESCVRENPNTTVARASYALFKEMLTLGYTGSGGTHIPGDVLAKIDELYRIAHGIPDIKEQI